MNARLLDERLLAILQQTSASAELFHLLGKLFIHILHDCSARSRSKETSVAHISFYAIIQELLDSDATLLQILLPKLR